MAIQCVRQPIIIMGMARSGTTLISDLLHRLGLFIGPRRIQVDQEATYFYSVNWMLLKRVHGYWDNPAPMRYFLKNCTAVDLTIRCHHYFGICWSDDSGGSLRGIHPHFRQ